MSLFYEVAFKHLKEVLFPLVLSSKHFLLFLCTLFSVLLKMWSHELNTIPDLVQQRIESLIAIT